MDVIQLPLIRGKLLEILLDQILYIESEEQLSLVHYQEDEILSSKYVNKSLGELEKEMLPFDFYRTHKCCLVNVAKVKSYGKYPDTKLMLSGGLSVALSRRKKLEFHNVYLNYHNEI